MITFVGDCAKAVADAHLGGGTSPDWAPRILDAGQNFISLLSSSNWLEGIPHAVKTLRSAVIDEEVDYEGDGDVKYAEWRASWVSGLDLDLQAERATAASQMKTELREREEAERKVGCF